MKSQKLGWKKVALVTGIAVLIALGWMQSNAIRSTTISTVVSSQASNISSPFNSSRESVADSVSPLASSPPKDIVQNKKNIVIERRDSEPDKENVFERVYITQTDFKYPFLRVVERVSIDAQTKEEKILKQTAMVADHIVVRIKDGIDETELAQINEKYGARIRKKLLAPNTYLVELKDHNVDSLTDAIKAYEQEVSSVEYAEPDYIVTISATIPNDTSFNSLWGMNQTSDADIDAPEAWDLNRGGNVLVGIIDTGLDYNHTDLAANAWVNPGEVANNSVDDDGNGFVDDTHGWDFYNNDNNPMDDNSHGTHCAGTIGGVGNNSRGVVGVCWIVKMVGLKFLSGGGSGSTSDAVDATYYATRLGVKLTSNSWGGGGFSQTLKNAIDNAGASNILFVAAAGNSAVNTDSSPQYPAGYTSENIISVASTDSGDRLSSFSNYGATTVDLGAPGSSIYSTTPNNSYGTKSGTSMATPHVSGACALLWSASSSLTAMQVKQRIVGTVDPLSALAGRCVSGGRLNVHRMLTSNPPEGLLPPSNLTASMVGSNAVAMSWKDNSTNETGFSIERRINTAAWAVWQTVGSNVTNANDSGLVKGSTYNYRVRAYNGSGNSYYSDPVSVVMPPDGDAWDPGDDTGTGSPSLILPTTTSQSHGPHTLTSYDLADWFEVRLAAGVSYNFNSIGGSGDTYAFLYRDRNGTQLVAYDDDSGGSYMFNLNYTAAATTSYFLKVRSYSLGANSSYSLTYRQTSASPNTPPSVAILSPTNNASFTEPGAFVFSVEASDADDGIQQVQFYMDSTLLGSDTTSPYSRTVTNVAVGSHLLWAVAVDTFNASTHSATVTVNVVASTLPAAPSSLSAVAPSSKRVALQWTDASANETGFAIERSVENSAFIEVARVVRNVTSFADRHVRGNTQYRYRVRAFNTSGYSDYSPVASVTTPVRPLIKNDFDGDDVADIGVFHPAAGKWYVKLSSTNQSQVLQWGAKDSIPVPGDYDGDGVTDYAVYFTSQGRWTIRQSESLLTRQATWGWKETLPVPADYDGDGVTDIAVFLPRSATWYIVQSSLSQMRQQNWGWGGTIPVPGDYDGDGKTDLAVYDPAKGDWYIRESAANKLRKQNWGYQGVQPVPADYDGDGKVDIAVFHPASGNWHILRSETLVSIRQNWGWSQTTPAADDYDGDGSIDVTVYHRNSGGWYILQSTSTSLDLRNWGWQAAEPIMNQYYLNKVMLKP